MRENILLATPNCSRQSQERGAFGWFGVFAVFQFSASILVYPHDYRPSKAGRKHNQPAGVVAKAGRGYAI
ncbi:hypothetical protein BG74_03880 [Sodalis-like endosymbiont of Proechinophthirus fluctus]|nr:hypothetical protein BG74_03880 [Sodalis-like endosymbiont of Proechinophthirus fluctus]